MADNKKQATKVVAQNKKAYHDYFVDEKYEAGIALFGTEVKSIRQGAVNLKDYKISKDKKTLDITVSAEEAEKILGIKVSATEDGVQIQVVHDGKNLRQIRVSYSTENATLVSLETSYSYSEVTSPFANDDATGE